MKKRNYANNRSKNMPGVDRGKRNKHMKNYYHENFVSII